MWRGVRGQLPGERGVDGPAFARDTRGRDVLQAGRVQVERTRYGPFERLSFTVMTLAGRSQHSLYRLGDTLIDAGGTVATAALLPVLHEHPPRRIVCTHQHEDHVGNVAAIRRAFGQIPVYVPREHVAIVTTTDRVPDYRATFWGHPEPTGPVEPYDPGAIFAAENLALEAVLTPGHTPHHIALVARNGDTTYALTGDLYTNRPLEAWYESATDDMAASLRKIARLSDRLRVLPTHGQALLNATTTEVPGILLKMADWLDLAAEHVRAAALRLGTDEPRTVAAAVYADQGPDLADQVSNGEISRAGFVRSILAPVRTLPAEVP